MRRCSAGRWWLVLLCTLGTGCAELDDDLGLMPTNATRRRFTNVDSAEVFLAAERALREEFRADVRLPDRGYLKSFPKESSATQGTGLLTDRMGIAGPSRVRRVAEFWVTPNDDAVTVRCKVTLERRDTSRRQAFARDHDVDDTPAGTPADLASEAGNPREEWTRLGNDDALERDLLASLQEQLIDMEPASTSTAP